MRDWDRWLERHGLAGYAKLFAENDIDAKILPEPNDEEPNDEEPNDEEPNDEEPTALCISLDHRRTVQELLRGGADAVSITARKLRGRHYAPVTTRSRKALSRQTCARCARRTRNSLRPVGS